MGANYSRKHRIFRIISLNMQMSVNRRWIKSLKNIIDGMRHYILCLQEVHLDMIQLLTDVFDLTIYRYCKSKNTCVLVSCKLPNDLMIDSVHLNDIPAPFHLLQKVYYEGHSEKDYQLTKKQIMEWSAKSRLPEIEPYLKKHINKRSIIAGDFNETKGWPVSQRMKQYGYSELGIGEKTWPVYPFYPGEPDQRIDFIYTRGVEQIQSGQYYEEKNWLSDHVAVISDVIL